MAKSQEKMKARALRRKGKSIKDIADVLNVAKSSVSGWCSDIALTRQHVEKLHKKMVRGSYAGRMKGAQKQREQKEARIAVCRRKAQKKFTHLSHKELFTLGLGLYWGEGSKSDGVRFSNSDDASVQIMMRWLRECLSISEERFFMHVAINDIHEKRMSTIIRHWACVTGVPITQFRKPVLIHVKNQKKYENFSGHYGTLSIRISRSQELLYQILEWMRAVHRTG